MTITERQQASKQLSQSVTAGTDAIETGMPLHGQLLDGSVVNVAVSTDKEHQAFLSGRFQRLADANGRRFDCGDFLKNDDRITAIGVFRIGSGSQQRLLGNLRDVCIAPLDPANASRGDHVLAIEDGVVEKILDAGIDIRHGKALQHVFLPMDVVVCEGQQTALKHAQNMLSDSDGIGDK